MQHASTMCYEIPENVTCSLNVLRNREKLKYLVRSARIYSKKPYVIALACMRFLRLTLRLKRSPKGHPWALKKELHCCNSLIPFVDQPGLEPGTSRL